MHARGPFRYNPALECILEPLSPAGGSDEPTEEGGSEGRVRGFQDALLVPFTFWRTTVNRRGPGVERERFVCRKRQVVCGIGFLVAVAFAPAVGSAQPVLYVDDSATAVLAGVEHRHRADPGYRV